jgi:K+-transporting ATPase ATPase C chain
MKDLLRPALATAVLSTALFGLVAPLAMTGIAQAVFPAAANGSLIERDGKLVGSALIGQNFTGAGYFHTRPSATAPEPYNGGASAASQYGPTSAALAEAIKGRVAQAGPAPVPADAVTASASGLDPHISPENAARQVARVAAARGRPEAEVAALLARNTEGRELGFLGEPRVNVLRLNLALDAGR